MSTAPGAKLEPERAGYSRLQIVLHWTVALLILLQFLSAGWMEDAFDARLDGEPIEADPLPHIVIGVAILLLALWRVLVRLGRGAPGHTPGEPTLVSRLAKLTHVLLYVFLFAMPLTGAIAWFGGVERSGDVHSALRLALLATVGLHILGALFEQFVLRTGVLMRMLRPER